MAPRREYTRFERGVIASLAWQIKGFRDGFVPKDATRRILRASLRRISPFFRGRSISVTEDTPTHIDHSIPISVVASLLLNSPDISISRITELLDRYLCSAEITEQEHRVGLRGYRSAMPADWDPECPDKDNDLARYKMVGIVLVEAEPPRASPASGAARGREFVPRERFPMRTFRPYARRHELDDDVVRIDQLAEKLPENHRGRKSTFRRGLAIELLEQENLLDSFLHENWPYGITAAGRSEMRYCTNFARRFR